MTTKRSLYARQMHPRRIIKRIAHKQATGKATELRALTNHSFEHRQPRPVTLPKLKFMETPDE